MLERGLLPTGASTRNAGFACFGSLTEVLYDLENSGADHTLAVIEKRIHGLQLLRQRLGDEAMDYQHVGGYELLFDKEMPALQHIEKANTLLQKHFPEAVYMDRPDLVSKFGFNQNVVRSIVYNPHEGHVHTGKMMRALLRLAQEKGIQVLTGAEVIGIEENPANVEIQVKESIRGTVNFNAQQVVVCTNAFINDLLPDCKITPGRGQVIITKPIQNLGWQGALHFDEGFYYFRNVGNRVLFGGGRNMAFAEETSHKFEQNAIILAQLEKLLREVILPGKDFEIEQRWSGIMGFSEDKQPIVKQVSDRIIVGFSCNGMGVSLSSAIGYDIAALVN
ncbi:MAG: NAD(P)/FAD-dependent oxidoreductase [Bacteroidia bacterium]